VYIINVIKRFIVPGKCFDTFLVLLASFGWYMTLNFGVNTNLACHYLRHAVEKCDNV
jgi:hypothetical protein